ncbi:MAG: hypothetical protein ACI9OJ_003539, partial [Myxococcota bacterium]
MNCLRSNRTRHIVACALLVALYSGCSADSDTSSADEDHSAEMDSGGDPDAVTCSAGGAGCDCLADGSCTGAGYECTENVCVPKDTCSVGRLGCECFGNGTCRDDLVCADDLCAEATCPAGDEGCACLDSGLCTGELECVGSTCAVPTCPEGSGGCPCYFNGTCNDGLGCQDGACAVVDCPAGGDGCPCLADDSCPGELVCAGGKCAAEVCLSGDEGCPCFPNDTCGAELTCVDAICASSTCDTGAEGCPCFGNGTCVTDLSCVEDVCEACTPGTDDCPCLGDGTCLDGLECNVETCSVPTCVAGTTGCPCLGNGTCISGLTCDAGTCTVDNCVDGAIGCPCLGNGNCDPGLECAQDNCVPADCEEGTQGCPCAAGAQCSDDLECAQGLCQQPPECVAGTQGCPCVAETCTSGLQCQSGTCEAIICPTGTVGCPCFVNNSCLLAGDDTLECVANVCVPPSCPSGTYGCSCKQDGSCGGGLVCFGSGPTATCEESVVCDAGADGCDCLPGELCDAGLYCDSGVCADPGCTLGELDCICGAGVCTGNGVVCSATGWCDQAACLVGSEGCPCGASSSCGINSRKELMACAPDTGICAAPSCVPGATGCVCAFGADCGTIGDHCHMGFCIAPNCAVGTENCACAGGACTSILTCRDGAICTDATGFVGGQCDDDGACTVGALCDAGWCLPCTVGTQGCDCTAQADCGFGLLCKDDTCIDAAGVVLPPDNPLCYTPCENDFVDPDEGKFVKCSHERLAKGCYGGLVCNTGSCTLPDESPPTCETALECAEHQTCIDGGCYSDCVKDQDCGQPGYRCVIRVCRQDCVVDQAECPEHYACRTVDGISGSCFRLVEPGEEEQTSVDASFEIVNAAIEFTNVSTSSKFEVINHSDVPQILTIRKRRHKTYSTDGEAETVDDPADDVECEVLKGECPLFWLSIGEEGAAQVQQLFQVTVAPNDSEVIEVAAAGGGTSPRWFGKLEVSHATLATQTVDLAYNEIPEGRWMGSVFYFADFGEKNLEEWIADKASALKLDAVGNALIRRWGAFRQGNLSLEEFRAVLQATRTESWDWNKVKADCPDKDGACYPYENNALGLVEYTGNIDANPIPSGAVELPIAMNLHLPNPNTQPGVMSGRIDSRYAMQYAGNPSITLDFGSDPSQCELETPGSCLVFVDDLDATILLGGRYQTTSADSQCGSVDGGFELKAIPWLVPSFERGVEYNDNGVPYRYECRDAQLPFAAVPMTDALQKLNTSMAFSNPIPDGRTRRRKLQLVDGALVNQSQMFILFKETFESFLPGDTKPFSAYGYIVMERQAADLDLEDANENGV